MRCEQSLLSLIICLTILLKTLIVGDAPRYLNQDTPETMVGLFTTACDHQLACVGDDNIFS